MVERINDQSDVLAHVTADIVGLLKKLRSLIYQIGGHQLCEIALFICLVKLLKMCIRDRIQGHEFSGVIEAVGERVSGWQLGQRVTADPNIYCHHCYYCLKDQENMCENAEASGVTRNGAFAEYVAVPASQLYEPVSYTHLDVYKRQT